MLLLIIIKQFLIYNVVMTTKTDELKSNITIRYVVALSFIAILSTVAFYLLHIVLSDTHNTAYLVNTSGKQRMLSQHIALDFYRIHDNFNGHKPKNTYGDDLTKQILKQHAKEMLQANTILSTGNLPDQNKISLSPTVYDMYFGEMNLAKRVEEYAKVALKVLQASDHDEIDKIKQIIDANSEDLLMDLNKIVKQYQIEGEKEINEIQVLKTIAWASILIVLLLEVIFIFQPMVKKIIFLTVSNDGVLKNLEDLVELRTLKLAETNNKLKYLASHDSLTGLRNRLNLEKNIEKAISNCKLHHSPFAVLMFDIDFFKDVNDTYGHDIGDFVLIELAKILKSSIREEDKVYRAGGEEFVVLLNRINYEDSISFAQKIRIRIQKHIFKINKINFSKTVSVGLFHSSILEAEDVKTVLKLIDIALYKSKDNGRNRLTNVDISMNN